MRVSTPKGNLITPFGPPVWIGKLDDAMIDHAIDCIESRRNQSEFDMSSRLAGRVDEQLTIEDIASEELKLHIIDHASEWAQAIGMEITSNDLMIDGLWVNLQNQFEYNPIHAHSGMFSFVFYTKNNMTREQAIDNKFDTSSNNPKTLAGHIELHYGETQFMNWTSMNHYPEKGDIIIFPSWLNHSVYPFHDPKGERVSVAGNMRYKE